MIFNLLQNYVVISFIFSKLCTFLFLSFTLVSCFYILFNFFLVYKYFSFIEACFMLFYFRFSFCNR